MVAENLSIFDELAYFLASLSPKKVLTYKVSPKAQERVNFLIDKNKKAGLSASENEEMERYMVVEHIVQLAKAKAIQKLWSREEYDAYIYAGIREQDERGRVEKAIENEKYDMILVMNDEGLPLSMIAKITKLDQAVVAQVIESQKNK